MSTSTCRSTPVRHVTGSPVYSRQASAHLDETTLVAMLMRLSTADPGFMVDVGAHRGGAFLPFRKAGWRVLAFEPDPRHHRFLVERLAGDPLVRVDERAVSDTSGDRVSFYISDESPGISGLSAFRDSHIRVGDVETVALRDVVGDEQVDFLKVDTEGFDLFVLRGYPWERSSPTVVVAEFEDRKTAPLGYRYDDLAAFLADKGYQVWVSEWHPVVRYGIRHDWRRAFVYEESHPDAGAWGNLMAFREPVAEVTMSVCLSALVRARDVTAVEQAAS